MGAIPVSPLQMMVADLVVIVLLLLWTPIEKNRKFPKAATALCVVSIFAAVTWGNSLKTVPVSGLGNIAADGRTVILNEQSWIGGQFPLFNFVEGETKPLLRGSWKVILFKESCAKCSVLLETEQEGKDPTVFIEIPPFNEPSSRKDTNRAIWHRLSEDYDWFVEVPKVFKIEDGVTRTIIQ